MSVTRKNSSSKGTSSKTKAADDETSGKKKTPTKPDEMTGEVLEFITAIDEYKRIHGRPFPSWSEVLEILKSLGYEKSA